MPGLVTGTTDLRIPRTLDELTPEWLTRALRRAGLDGVTVRNARLEPFATGGYGLLCVLGRLALGYEVAPPGAPPTLVAKLPKQEPHVQEFGKILRAWETESLAYARLLPRLDVRTARCFYNGCDVSANAYALLLEDLGGLAGGNQVEGVTRPQARLAVRWLAGLHAAWWGSAELAASEWLSTENEHDRRAHAMIQASWETFRSLFAADAPARVFDWIERMIPRYAEPTRTAIPTTLLHNDFRADNLFFDGDHEMVAVDWQLVCRGHGIRDVAYLLGTQMTVEERRATERDLLGEYREALLQRGADPGSFDRVFEMYRLSLLRLAAYVVIAATMMGDPNPATQEIARNGVVRALAAADDLDVGSLLE